MGPLGLNRTLMTCSFHHLIQLLEARREMLHAAHDRQHPEYIAGYDTALTDVRNYLLECERIATEAHARKPTERTYD